MKQHKYYENKLQEFIQTLNDAKTIYSELYDYHKLNPKDNVDWINGYLNEHFRNVFNKAYFLLVPPQETWGEPFFATGFQYFQDLNDKDYYKIEINNNTYQILPTITDIFDFFFAYYFKYNLSNEIKNYLLFEPYELNGNIQIPLFYKADNPYLNLFFPEQKDLNKITVHLINELAEENIAINIFWLYDKLIMELSSDEEN